MIVSQHYTNSLIKIFRNTDQKIDILLKDWDRRPVKYEETQELWFKLFDADTEILEIEAELLDWDRGHYVLSFTSVQTGTLALGNYTWCIVVKDTEVDTTTLLFTNQDYGADAPAKVFEGPLPLQTEAQNISLNSLSTLSGQIVSAALVGAAQKVNPTGTHSFVLSLTDYTGTFTVQATLDAEIPSDSNNWTNVVSETYADETGINHVAVVGNFNWLRLVFDTIEGIEYLKFRNS